MPRRDSIDEGFLSRHKWFFFAGIGGIVLLVLVGVLFSFIKPKDEAQNAALFIGLDQNIDVKAWADLFEKECPVLEDCPVSSTNAYLIKFGALNVSPAEIPRISEIRSFLSARLASDSQHLNEKNIFSENYYTILASMKISMMDAAAAETWIKRLIELDPDALCKEFYTEEPQQGSKVFACFRDRLSLLNRIIGLVYVIGGENQNPSIDFFHSPGYDFDAVNNKICPELNSNTADPDFFFLSVEGSWYLNYIDFCNKAITPAEKTKIIAEMQVDVPNDPWRDRAIKLYEQLI
jgi:hypothetical protein